MIENNDTTGSNHLDALHQRLTQSKDLSDSLRRELVIWERNLRLVEETRASYGLDVPLHIQNEVNLSKEKVQEISNEIVRMEAQIDEIKDEIVEYTQQQHNSSRMKQSPGHQETLYFNTYHASSGFDEYAKDAKEIFVAGGSLDTLIELYRFSLVDRAKEGCQVRLILMDPSSPAIPQVELWSSPGLPPGHFLRAICRSLRLLAIADVNRKLEVRFDQSIPAQSIVILDGSQPHGRIRVDLQPFQCLAVQRPVFELTRKGANQKWYELFYKQYAMFLWSQAKPVNLSELPFVCSQFEFDC